MSDDSVDDVIWLTPWSYPTRVTNEMAEDIAVAILGGASIAAAGMSFGVSRERLYDWLKWGRDAYTRDAGAEDYHSQYLNLYIKVMQAVGLSAIPAQQAAHHTMPSWWLAHNPETRGEWGDGNRDNSVLALPTPEEVEQPAQDVPLLSDDVDELREVMKIMVESGAAIPDAVTGAADDLAFGVEPNAPDVNRNTA